MSAYSFLLYLLSVYYMPGTVLGTQAKSETNKTDKPTNSALRALNSREMVEFPFYHESRKQWASLRKQDLSKDLMGTKEFVCLVGMLENIPEKCRRINDLSLPRM